MAKVTSVEVFRKIKELSRRTMKANHRILLSDIATGMDLSHDSLLVMLVELENRGLVRIFKTMVLSVSLTSYGISQDDPPSGLGSE